VLTFTRKVLSAYKRYGFESLFIIGPQGSGKTTYALLVLYEVYRDWGKVLEYTFFDLERALKHLDEALNSGERLPVILFDDAGIHLSKYLWYSSEGRALVMWFNALYNLIRTICAAVIFTSPDLDTLVEVRKKSWWVGEPKIPHQTASDAYERHMVLYKKRVMASGQVIVSKRAIDVYRLDIIPNDVRKKYEEMRREALKKTLRLVKEAADRMKASLELNKEGGS